jgi:hypothetical protein
VAASDHGRFWPPNQSTRPRPARPARLTRQPQADAPALARRRATSALDEQQKRHAVDGLHVNRRSTPVALAVASKRARVRKACQKSARIAHGLPSTKGRPGQPWPDPGGPGGREDRMAAACAKLRRGSHQVFRLSIDGVKTGQTRTAGRSPLQPANRQPSDRCQALSRSATATASPAVCTPSLASRRASRWRTAWRLRNSSHASSA